MNREESIAIETLREYLVAKINSNEVRNLDYVIRDAIIDLDLRFRTHSHTDEYKPSTQLLTLKYQDSPVGGLQITGTVEQIADLLAILKQRSPK